MVEQVVKRIHHLLATTYVVEGALIGPDPGVRFNYRFWRFLKSYLPGEKWNDDLYYLQAQGYWVLANWELSQTESDNFAVLAIAASDQIVQRQRCDGSWDYPNPEWKGRVATVEGAWATLGLLESYRHTADSRYLQSALRWHDFFQSRVGYQDLEGRIAVNYFADEASAPVPNNSALVLRYLANLADVTGDPTYLSKCDGLLHFIRDAQLPSGEVPYVYGDPGKVHFQCFQYQAFLCLDLMNYYCLTGDAQAQPVLGGLLRFLKNGISPSGFAYYQCGQHHRTVNYHTCAVATALSHGKQLGLTNYGSIADRALGHLFSQQRVNGSIPHSRGDYRILRDNRVYPRYLAMMLYHLAASRPKDIQGIFEKETLDTTSRV